MAAIGRSAAGALMTSRDVAIRSGRTYAPFWLGGSSCTGAPPPWVWSMGATSRLAQILIRFGLLASTRVITSCEQPRV